MDHATSYHHAGPLPDDSCCVLMDPSTLMYDVFPLSISMSTFSVTHSIVFSQTLMVDMDPHDDSSSLPIADVPLPFQDSLVSGVSCPHVVEDNTLISGSHSAHV